MAILIETERMILRQFTEEDAEALCAVCNQEYILKWMPDWEGNVEQNNHNIKFTDEHLNKHDNFMPVLFYGRDYGKTWRNYISA